MRVLNSSIKYVARDTSASPATGSRTIHVREQQELVEVALKGTAPHLVRAFPFQIKRPESGENDVHLRDQERAVEVKPA